MLKSALSEVELQRTLQDVNISVAAYATEADPEGSLIPASSSGKHDIDYLSASASDVVAISTIDDTAYVIWKQRLRVSRPRVRLQRPALYFTAALNVRQDALREVCKPDNPVLDSFEPFPANVLEPLQSDPHLSESGVYLPDARITKVAPRAPGVSDAIRPIRGVSRQIYPALPALFTKVEYHPLPDAVVASVHLEAFQLIDGLVTIDKVEVGCPGVEVEPLSNHAMPSKISAGDEVVLLFHLSERTDRQPSEMASNLTTTVTANVCEDEVLQGQLSMSWQTPMKMATPPVEPVLKWNQSTSDASVRYSQASTFASSRSSTLERQLSPMQDAGDVLLQISCPAATTIHQEFQLRIRCKNRSNRSRCFNIYPTLDGQVKQNSHADAEATLHLERSDRRTIINARSDTQIGPVSPGSICETSMTFRTLATGVIDLGTICIVDTDTGRTVRLTELPNLVSISPRNYP